MSLLNQIKKGKEQKPIAAIIHGIQGVGKSTLADEFPSPIFIGNEDTENVDGAKFPKVEKWQDLADQLKALRDEDHEFKTVVIDSLDGLEQVAELAILEKEKGKTMATAFGGYGKAYLEMAKMFMEIRDEYLVPLREVKGMNIVMLAHTEKVKHEDPITNTAYDHYETAIHKKVKHLFEDWCSAILFLTTLRVRAENNSGKEYAQDFDGQRVLLTESRSSHIAKNRFDMDYSIEFAKGEGYKKIKEQVDKFFKSEQKPELEILKKSITEKLEKASDDVQDSVKMSLKKVGNNEKELTRINEKLAKLIA